MKRNVKLILVNQEHESDIKNQYLIQIISSDMNIELQIKLAKHILHLVH